MRVLFLAAAKDTLFSFDEGLMRIVQTKQGARKFQWRESKMAGLDGHEWLPGAALRLAL
jgi:hypothetical protein